MSKTTHFFLRSALAWVIILGLHLSLFSQSISIYQYRYVPQDKVEEFIKRETTYWHKVAENAITKGNLEFWGLFQKVGGFNVQNSPNFLFINTFKDIDAMEGVWDPAAVWPDTPMEEMETWSMSEVRHNIFVRPESWAEAEGAVPEEHFNYVSMLYHNSDTPAQIITLENEHWMPFIKKAMDEGKTSQKAWGNASILTPSTPTFRATTISMDLYPTLKEALTPYWSEDLELPEEGLTKINEAENERRVNFIYRVVKVANAEQE